MAKLNLNSILFNAAGAGIVLIVAGYMVKSFFVTDTTPQCSQRYTTGQQFPLHSAKGVALSPLELQARVSTREWGLLNNARVIEASDKSAMYLQVAMTAADSEEDANSADSATTNGVGFTWQPQSLSGTRAACLAYRVYLPKNFSFAGPGTLARAICDEQRRRTRRSAAHVRVRFEARVEKGRGAGDGIPHADFGRPLAWRPRECAGPRTAG